MLSDTRNVNDIVNNAFYLIGVITPDVIPPANLISRGLYVLNDLIDSFSAVGINIPFIKEIDITLIPNQDTYTISNIVPADINAGRIVELDFVNLLNQQILYPVRVIDRGVLFNTVRYPQIVQRPGTVFLDKFELFSSITFYPAPDLAYACKIRAKFMLDRLSLFQEITEVPPYYYRWLKYAVARELTSYYPSSSWTDKDENEYQIMLKKVSAATEVNLLIYPDNLLMFPYRYGYYTRFGII